MSKQNLLGLVWLALFAIQTAAAAENASCSGGENSTVVVKGRDHCRSSHPIFGFVNALFYCQPEYELKVTGEVSLAPVSKAFSESKSSLPIDICFGSGQACTPGTLSTTFKYIAEKSIVTTTVVMTYYGSQTYNFLIGNFSVDGLNCTNPSPAVATTSPPSVNQTTAPLPTNQSANVTMPPTAPTPTNVTTNTSAVTPSAEPSPSSSVTHSPTMSPTATPSGTPNRNTTGTGDASTLVGPGGLVMKLASAQSLAQFVSLWWQFCPAVLVMSLGVIYTLV